MIAVRSFLVAALLWEAPAVAQDSASSPGVTQDGIAAQLAVVQRQLAAAQAEIARLRGEADAR